MAKNSSEKPQAEKPQADDSEPIGSAALPATAPESAASAAPPATAASAAESAPAERDFDVTLKSNDNPTATQTVVARGTDPGLAAQSAMRQHPGWTADHAQTHPHNETHPADTTHGER